MITEVLRFGDENKMKKMIFLGNGFTIDFLNQLDDVDDIDVINLFKNGDDIEWPENNISGFLSYRHCPNLWNLGIRPYESKENNYAIFEDIITCANMSNEFPQLNIENKIYLKAYKELINYLKFLFISYNKNFSFNESSIKEWGWYKFFFKLEKDDGISEVNIITFNYDIFLEQILQTIGIDFNISAFENKSSKFNIIKPHGSISFRHKTKLESTAYRIKYELESLITNVTDYEIDYNFDYTKEIPIVSALLPPAGDSSRFNKLSWAKTLRDVVMEKTKQLNSNDDIIICGLSYWHVDRQEIDKYLTRINENVNVYLINPNPPSVFNAVLTTIFKNVVVYRKSDNLGK